MPVCAEINTFIDGRESYFYTKDISATGAFLISDFFPRLGSTIELYLSIPFMKGLMKIEGEVVRHQDYGEKDKYRNLRGFGIRFRTIPEKNVRDIDEVIGRILDVVSKE